MITPPFLGTGDTIGIFAPARFVTRDEMTPFIQYMESRGYKVRFSRNLFGRSGQFSGNPGEQVEDLLELINDIRVKAIFAARGGYGSARLLPLLPGEGKPSRPVWLVGFSDVTALHALFNREMESIHGVMPYSFVMEPSQEKQAFDALEALLRGKKMDYCLEDHPLNNPGLAKGAITGGNLSVLYSLSGTPYDPDYEGKLLFLEDVDEYLYHIDRIIMNLEMRDVFRKVAGLIIGDFSAMHDNVIPFGRNALEIIAERVHKYNVPALFGFPAGHKISNLPLIFGRFSTLKVSNGENSLAMY